MDKDLMIDLKDIVIHRDERNILSISTQIPRQGITAVIGPNGSGKTTLLKLLHGAIEADAGTYKPGSAELESASIAPCKSFSRVVLPEPFGPITAVMPCLGIWAEIERILRSSR